MGRKRPRSRAALTDDDEQPIDIIDESTESAQDHGSNSQTDDLPEERREELHADVWDAFKEEHHEVLEQLPLSVHRQFKLMRELDSHSAIFHVDLLASVRRYIQLRESLAARNTSNAVEAQPNATTHLNTADVGETGDMSPNAMQVDSTESTHDATVNDKSANAHFPAAFQPNPGETTRTRLQHIAQTSEEAIRTAEEKVNIAQTAYETVDRHIRLLDQAIKEQEAAISLGVRPGTHLAPILLPDLVVPRWARATRVEHSPVPSLSPEPGLYIEEPPILELSPPSIPSPKVPKKGKKAAAPKPSKPEKEETHPPVVVDGEESLAASRTRRMSVRLTLPAQQPVAVEPTVPADPREKRYCYCNQVSFGTMIGCDMPGCKLEWFHFECTGLLEVPSKKTKWYCQECKPKMTQKGRSKA
ncbi:hypothetical protein L210DRAFT_3483220 [Boletus edulis BED1]|uniref:Chromatin modification-related protein n=1 Tax=Boletus edulis BED1 TaxID=1328754 RepID=A0AAD4GDI6_BOLED|nr:hypothetical protein L210DRAFT_3483220 [Boletus edulis BED1]